MVLNGRFHTCDVAYFTRFFIIFFTDIFWEEMICLRNNNCKIAHITDPYKLAYLAAICSGVRLSSLDRTSIRAP